MKVTGRIPSLDGVRALSIGLVLVSHAVGTRGFEVRSHFLDLGNFGVRIFFVISGYLITTLLLDEQARAGRISLRGFYLRRTFRIFPAFYAYVGALMIADAAGWISLRDGDAIHAVTYTMNYHAVRAWELGHIWSLAVEEQFYLLWPAVLVVAGRRVAPWLAAAYVVAGPVIRVVTWWVWPDGRAGIDESFQTVADAIAIGCVLAFVRPRLATSTGYLRLQRHPAFVLVPIVALVANYARRHPAFSLPIGETAMNVCIALAIDWAMRHHDGAVGRVLNARALVYAGTLSYSLYLWQQAFLDRHSTAWVCRFPQNLGFAFAAALGSFYAIERPFLRWRVALSRRATP